ncbi:MAG: DoxX family protein [Sphingomicrobium sp.]
MRKIIEGYDRATIALAGKIGEGISLLFLRVVFAGIFWRSGRTKIEEGSWITISDTAKFLFSEEYSGVPLPPELAAVAATTAEHLFPVLLLIGLATRLSAAALLVMTLVIQFFVYPDAWWTVHSLWVAMALVLIVRGGGQLSVDALLTRGRRE